MSTNNDVLARVRKGLMKLEGASEQVLFAESEELQELWAEKQSLMAEMNAAKKFAAEQAAAPYKEVIERLDKRYALYIKMRS